MEFSPERLGNVAAAFRRVAEVHAADGYAPIYQQMAAGVADDPELLAIAATASPGQNPPILLLAAAQFLLTDHPEDPLVRFYPVLSGEPAPQRDPYPALRDFVLAHRDAVTEIVATRLVQTNEPGRSCLLYPALLVAQRLGGGRPLALIEVGASAGLTLVPDRYAYDYRPEIYRREIYRPETRTPEIRDTGVRCGDPASPLVLNCTLRGELVPPLAGPLTVAWRAGIDLNPLSLDDPADRRWLRALVWPDHPGRAARLDLAARAAARGRLPVIHRGDATGRLPALLAQAPAGTTVVVYHTAVLSHFTDQDRTEFVRTLPELSARRPFTWVQGESGLDRVPRLRVARLADGRIQAEHVLGHYHPHGAWLEWLDTGLAG